MLEFPKLHHIKNYIHTYIDVKNYEGTFVRTFVRT